MPSFALLNQNTTLIFTKYNKNDSVVSDNRVSMPIQSTKVLNGNVSQLPNHHFRSHVPRTESTNSFFKITTKSTDSL